MLRVGDPNIYELTSEYNLAGSVSISKGHARRIDEITLGIHFFDSRGIKIQEKSQHNKEKALKLRSLLFQDSE